MDIRKTLSGDEISEWFYYDSYYERIAKMVHDPPDFRRFLELGAYKGNSICFLADKINEYIDLDEVEIYTIDTFNPTFTSSVYWRKESNLKEMCMSNIDKLGMTDIIDVMEGTGHYWKESFFDGYFDFVFIDADHSYESVKQDIDDWYPKVRVGGILAGHDYAPTQHGIRKAVDDRFGDRATKFEEHPVLKKCSVWEVIKWE